MNLLKTIALIFLFTLAACEKDTPPEAPKKVWMVYEAACDSCKISFLNPKQGTFTTYDYLNSGLVTERDTFEFTEGDSMYIAVGGSIHIDKATIKTNIYYVGNPEPVIPWIVSYPTRFGAQIKYHIPKTN